MSNDSDSSQEQKGTLSFMHKSLEESLVDGKRSVHEEMIMHGSRGFTAKYYSKKNGKIMKIVVKGDGDSFTVTTKEDDKEPKTENMSKKEFFAHAKKTKELKFIADAEKNLAGGKRRKSRRSSGKMKGGEIEGDELFGGARRRRKSSRKMSGGAKRRRSSSRKAAKSTRKGSRRLLDIVEGGARRRRRRTASRSKSRSKSRSGSRRRRH